jgi:hypothetical protein
MTLTATMTFPVVFVPGCFWYTTAMISWQKPQMIRPQVRKIRRLPYQTITPRLMKIATTPTETRIQEFMNGFPTLAISKKYVPYAAYNCQRRSRVKGRHLPSINITPEAACTLTAPTGTRVLLKSTPRNISNTTIPLSNILSFSIANSISFNSAYMLSASGLNHLSAFLALSTLPCCTSHRGDSGIKNIPTARIVGTI